MVDRRKLSFAPAHRANWPTSPAQGRRRRGLVSFRWLLLLLFAAGYLSTRQVFHSYAAEYLALSLVSLAACALLLAGLRAAVKAVFPLWVLLLIFCVGYYLQFFILVINPHVYAGVILAVGESSPPVLLAAYRIATLAFVMVCSTGWLLVRMQRQQQKNVETQREALRITLRSERSVCTLLLIVILLLELITGYASWATGIAVMAAEAVTLPYRLAGVLFYTRFVILPGLFLLLIWLADRFKSKGLFRAGVGLLIGHAVAEAILRSSRATGVFALLGLIFLFSLTQRWNRRRLGWIAAGLAISGLLFPVLTAYRSLRVASGPEVVGPLRDSFRYSYGSASLTDTVSETFSGLVFRVTGMGSLLKIVAIEPEPLGLARANEVTPFMNWQVLGIPPGVMNSVAPSLVGWFYLVGGNVAVVLGLPAFVLATQLAWGFLRSSKVFSGPAAQALFLTFLVPVATDGVLEECFWTVLGVAVSIGAAELLLRLFRAKEGALAEGANSPRLVAPA